MAKKDVMDWVKELLELKEEYERVKNEISKLEVKKEQIKNKIDYALATIKYLLERQWSLD